MPLLSEREPSSRSTEDIYVICVLITLAEHCSYAKDMGEATV